MNDGVKILLERMETHPEEFVIEEGVVAKWDVLISSYEGVLPPEDIKAFKEARNVLLQQQFTEKVLEELVDPKKLSLEELLIAKRNAIPSATTTRKLYSNGIGGNATLLAQQQLQVEHIKAHVEALKKQSATPIAGVTQTV